MIALVQIRRLQAAPRRKAHEILPSDVEAPDETFVLEETAEASDVVDQSALQRDAAGGGGGILRRAQEAQARHQLRHARR